MLKQTSIAIFIFFIIATVLSYVSMFLPYYDGVNFDMCFNAVEPIPCKIGSILHIATLVLSTLVIGIFFAYVMLHFMKTNANKFFVPFNIPVILFMVLAFLMSVASSVLINDTHNLENNINQLDGFYTLTSSTCVYFICMILLIVHFFILKK